jgi:hypothetical protein
MTNVTQWIIGLSVLLFFTKAEAEIIPGSVVTVGSWKVSAYTNKITQQFDYCVAIQAPASGLEASMRYAPSGLKILGLAGARWALTSNEITSVTIYVGQGGPFNFSARATSPKSLSIAMSQDLFSLLRSGRQLTAMVKGSTLQVGLDGIEDAEAKLRSCVLHYGRRAPSSQAIGK